MRELVQAAFSMEHRSFKPAHESEALGSHSQMRSRLLAASREDLAHKVIGLAIEVHRALGPGMLESIYEEALVFELALAGVPFERQKAIEVPYKNTVLKGQRLDLLVAGQLLVELKSTTQLHPLFEAQTLGYLRAIDEPLGLLFNFNAPKMIDGVKRVLNVRWSGFKDRTQQPQAPL